MAKVQRFLNALIIKKYIVKETDAGIIIITIRNYDVIQKPWSDTVAPNAVVTLVANSVVTSALYNETNESNEINKDIPPNPPRGNQLALIPGEEAVSPQPEKKSKSRKSDPLGPDSQFDEFFSIFPKKVNPIAAQRQWNETIRRTKPEMIIAAVVRYRQEWEDDRRPEKEKIQFGPRASSWLKDGGHLSYPDLVVQSIIVRPVESWDRSKPWLNPALNGYQRFREHGRANGLGENFQPNGDPADYENWTPPT